MYLDVGVEDRMDEVEVCTVVVVAVWDFLPSGPLGLLPQRLVEPSGWVGLGGLDWDGGMDMDWEGWLVGVRIWRCGTGWGWGMG